MLKRAVSIFLCLAMLISICTIGASSEDSVIEEERVDAVTTEGYGMSFKYFVGSGGNVLITGLQGLTLSDISDLTITLSYLDIPCFSFAEDEIIVEQPNEYHNDIELYLKNDNLPSSNDISHYKVRIESGSLTDINGGSVNMIERDISFVYFSPYFDYYNPETYDLYIGSFLSIRYHDYSDRNNSFAVTTETPETLLIGDKTKIEIIGAGEAQFTVKYNDFVYETFSFQTYNTKLGHFISTHTISSINDYFNNIGNAFTGIARMPELIVASMIIGPLPLLLGLIIIPFNLLCSLFGLKPFPTLDW